MSYIIKNKAKQPLVCDLADKTTLRLVIDGEKTVTDTQMTDHIRTLSSKGLVILTEVESEKKKVTKNSTAKSSEVEKEDK